MKGLLLKDMYSVINNGRGLLLMMLILAFALAPSNGLTGFIITGTVICSMMSTTSFSIDHRHHWNSFAFTLPLSRQVIVGSKFISLLVFTLLGAVLSILFGIIAIIIVGKNEALIQTPIENILIATSLAIGISMIFGTNAVILFLKYGAEQARLYLLASYLIPAALFSLIFVSRISTWFTDLDIYTIAILFTIIVIGWILIGYFLSVRILNNKQY
ncbi:ABC-2 transporter permease [Paenibacillus yanchengensis]|uniref:ABC-2 transporter permease n=1 Tax=Paenibacillus yanchengensis TaxID=2035833 RepID=A0ABW4YNX6_9BACL